jgi:hypothetical protein
MAITAGNTLAETVLTVKLGPEHSNCFAGHTVQILVRIVQYKTI